MAAASLTESFNDIKKEFEKQHPDIKIQINYAGSQELVTQIELGVKADVFASANEFYMDKLSKENLVNNPKIFAHNKLIVAVSSSNKNIQNLNDLAKSGVKLAIASPAVPVGKYTLEMLSKIEKSGKFNPDYKKNFLHNVVTEELNVKSVLTKVTLGEADAGVVYKTDITPEVSKKVRIISIDNKYNVIASYPIALIKESANPKQAKSFISYVLSNNGQNILGKYGFMK